MQNTSLLTIFLTGLLSGGLTCMAVQGGLLAATIAQREQERLQERVKTGTALPILSFLVTKLIAYTLLGLLLGWLGSFFQFSLTTQVVLQFVVIVFMIGTALNLLNVHPIFRYFVVQPPRFLTRLIRKESKSKSLFAPALLGAFTVFIPCGTTQAMMALAIASGTPLSGAAILFAFTIGTSPLFFLLGYFATKLGDVLQARFMRIAAIVILFLALFNLNNAILLSGSNYTLSNLLTGAWCAISYCSDTTLAELQTPNNNASLVITANGYSPNDLTVQAGKEVKIHLTNAGGGGCTQAFTIPSMQIQKIVPIGRSDTVTFTAPTKPGTIAFMCSMGMYTGHIHII
jgi:sulfite exporter TauE/SafE